MQKENVIALTLYEMLENKRQGAKCSHEQYSKILYYLPHAEIGYTEKIAIYIFLFNSMSDDGYNPKDSDIKPIPYFLRHCDNYKLSSTLFIETEKYLTQNDIESVAKKIACLMYQDKNEPIVRNFIALKNILIEIEDHQSVTESLQKLASTGEIEDRPMFRTYARILAAMMELYPTVDEDFELHDSVNIENTL